MSNRPGIFRKIVVDFKKIIHRTKPIRDPRNVSWLEFSFQNSKYMIYPGGSAKYGKTEKKCFEPFFASQCDEVQIMSVPTYLIFKYHQN